MFNHQYTGSSDINNNNNSSSSSEKNDRDNMDNNHNTGAAVNKNKNENASPLWNAKFGYDSVDPASVTGTTSMAPDVLPKMNPSSGAPKHRNKNGLQVSFKEPPPQSKSSTIDNENDDPEKSPTQKPQTAGFTFTNPWNKEPLPPVQQFQSTYGDSVSAAAATTTSMGPPSIGTTSSISPLNFLDPSLYTDDYNRRKSILVIPPKRVPNPVPLQSDVYNYARMNYGTNVDNQMYGSGFMGTTPIFNQSIFQMQHQQSQQGQQQQQPSHTLLLNKLQQAQKLQTRHFPFIYNVQESQRRQSVAVGVGMEPYGMARSRGVHPFGANLPHLPAISTTSGSGMVGTGPLKPTVPTITESGDDSGTNSNGSNIIVDRDLPGLATISPGFGHAALSSSGTPSTITAGLTPTTLGPTFGAYSMMKMRPPMPPMYRRLSAYPMAKSSLAPASASTAAVTGTSNVTVRSVKHPLERQFRLGVEAREPVVPRMHRKRQPAVPHLKVCHSKDDLKPVVNKAPKFRRASLNTKAISPLIALTKNLITTYQLCSSDFTYHTSRNPRRVLTRPCVPAGNDGYDNVDSDYILYVNDVLGTEQNRRYLVLDILGSGTFGQVVKCQNLNTKKLLAVKVIKSKSEYVNQSLAEINILELLNTKIDPDDTHHFLRMYDSFVHKNHLCLVFELLSKNLYELLKINQFYGLSISLIKVFAKQILESLRVLKSNKLIHCDLKPENILLVEAGKPDIKLIDFGSACEETRTIYTYIQSRFYRSPEVILGIPYTTSIDMWSFGCIIAELFLGIPIFPGSSEFNQLTRIIDMLGYPPNWMMEMDKGSLKYLKRIDYDDDDDDEDDIGDIDSDLGSFDGYGSGFEHQCSQRQINHSARRRYRLKSLEEFNMEYPNAREEPGKQYFKWDTLEDIIIHYRMPRKIRHSDELIELELEKRECLVHFLNGILDLNPMTRWTPEQALLHPFITNQPFTGEWFPPGVFPAGR